ncbi:MAG TPA: hypothetical protein VHB79_08630 [Polyangiaceae bacterium]|nr:hypothetical protein [Polyangiaceae bacterium]
MKSIAALGAAMATALVLTPHTSAAQGTAKPTSDSEAVSLMYEDSPPPDCPSQAEFEAEVAKLTSKAHFTKQRRARRVRIELSASGRDVMGRLISGDGKNQASREVRGKTCREVASALAIAVALTIDPEALGLGDSEPQPEPEPPPADKKPPEQPKPVEAPAKRAPPPPPGPAEIPTRVLWGFSLGLVLENAWAPQMRPGGHLAATLGVGDRFRTTVGVSRFLTREVDDLSFGAWVADGAVSVNLAVLGAVRPFALVGYEMGSVDAAGTGLSSTVQAQRPWQAAYGGLGLRFETDSFFLQLGGYLLVPISRQRYLISDQFGEVHTLYEVPRLGLKQETSLGVFL